MLSKIKTYIWYVFLSSSAFSCNATSCFKIRHMKHLLEAYEHCRQDQTYSLSAVPLLGVVILVDSDLCCGFREVVGGGIKKAWNLLSWRECVFPVYHADRKPWFGCSTVRVGLKRKFLTQKYTKTADHSFCYFSSLVNFSAECKALLHHLPWPNESCVEETLPGGGPCSALAGEGKGPSLRLPALKSHSPWCVAELIKRSWCCWSN